MVSRGIHDRGPDQAGVVSSLSSFSISLRPYCSAGTSGGLLVCAEPMPQIHESQVSPFAKEACVCRDDRDPVPFNLRRAGILPVCPAPDYLRQEGGGHGTQI